MSVLATSQGQDDIYRGQSSHPLPDHPVEEPAPSLSSRSSPSSSLFGGGPIGAIAGILELAITRWARNVRGDSSTASSSSTSSASDTSSLSLVTLTKSQLARRRRRRPSVSSLRTLQSQRDIAARITRMKALHESRQIPREFALYVPPSIVPSAQQRVFAPVPTDMNAKREAKDRRIMHTTSLPLILGQLDDAMRKSGKYRRARQREGQGPVASSSANVSSFPIPGTSKEHRSAQVQSNRRFRKDKHRMEANTHLPKSIPEEPQTKPQAWFLDVANPTWADLQAIGKLLHIHPLTLEDILQQDPREKLESFPKLGYYFVSFRAIESQATREKIQREAGFVGAMGRDLGLDEGSIGEANVYLTVFNDGICCFHFTDVSEHINHVRDRIVLLEEVMNMSSDWIAHGILDSIVDCFIPFLDEIEKEVMAIDDIVYAGSHDHFPTTPVQNNDSNAVRVAPPFHQSPTSSKAEKPATEDHEKFTPAEELRESYRHPHFAPPSPAVPLLLRRMKRHISNTLKSFWLAKPIPLGSTQLTLRRMARTRKLVTVLGRLLASKSDVVTQIRKRLTKAGLDGERHATEELELAIYMGDVEDHILTLHQSLAHYERMLSQSHPTYLSQLRSTFERTKGGTDANLVYLTVVSISVLCLQTLTGLFSLNINVPSNSPEPDGLYTVFGIVLALATFILSVFLVIVRHWWKKSKRRRIAPL